MKNKFVLSFATYTLLLCTIAWGISKSTFAQTNSNSSVKNLILLIADGTSWNTVSLARWYQRYTVPNRPKLHIDPFICGSVITFSSNAPIGDSAPTTSCYVTGIPSQTGFIATYPPADTLHDLFTTDPEKSYQPLMTIMEASRIALNKATGLVFTCEFPHATPADCAAHCENRNHYQKIAEQMIHNQINIVMGGGNAYLTPRREEFLLKQGYSVYRNNNKELFQDTNSNIWALFGHSDMRFDIDRNETSEPSLAAMTHLAIQKLSKNKNGFFLMVEGSKIDWAAHNNDPVGMITDFLAFDKACKEALSFAMENGETAVIIVSDHGNSGISIGNLTCQPYDELNTYRLFHYLSLFKNTAEGIADKINNVPESHTDSILFHHAHLTLSQEERNALYACKGYKYHHSDAVENAKNIQPHYLSTANLTRFVAHLINHRTCLGFTTDGHTGEEVFLAAYHPKNNIPTGVNTNQELHRYMTDILGLNDLLPSLTAEYFANHHEVFAGAHYRVIPAQAPHDFPTLMVNFNEQHLEIPAYSNQILHNNTLLTLPSVVVYSEPLNTFFLPKSLSKLLQ